MLRVSFNTSSNEARDVRISSAITSKALPKSAVTVAFPPGWSEEGEVVGSCLKAFAKDWASVSAKEGSRVMLPPAIWTTPPVATGVGVSVFPAPSSKSSLLALTKAIPLSVLTFSICSTSKRPPGIRLKKSVMFCGRDSNSSSNSSRFALLKIWTCLKIFK